MKYFFLTLFLVGMSCSSQKETVTQKSKPTKMTSELTLLLRDSHGGAEEPQIQVIKEPKALEKFFIQVNKTRKPGLAIPKINFETEMVIIVCSGGVQGNAIPVLYKIEEMEDKMVLGVKEENILKDANGTAYITPFCMYKMPLSNKEISFKHD